MDENTLSALLHKAPDNLSPATSKVSLDRALQDGRRRQRLNRATLSATATTVAAAAVAATVLLPGSTSVFKTPFKTAQQAGAGSQPAAQASATAGPRSAQLAAAPKSFNPMELPANFGWLPAGFTEDQPAPDQFPMSQGPLDVTPTRATFGASVSTDNGLNQEGLQVTISARGVTPTPYAGGSGSTAEEAVTGTAPDVNGHPAKWLAGGLEWEYATGGWATILTGGAGTMAAKAGWGQSCTIDAPKHGSKIPAHLTPLMVRCSPLPPQPAQLRVLLEKVASNIKYTPISFAFPYEFTRALPEGLTVGEVNGSFVNGRLTSGELDLNVAGVTGTRSPGDVENAITIDAWSDTSSHSFCPPQTGAYFDTINGVKWQIQSVKGSKPDYESSATACSGTPVDAKGGSAGLGFDDYSAAGFQVGYTDEKALLPLIKFLPANPADWTTSPLTN